MLQRFGMEPTIEELCCALILQRVYETWARLREFSERAGTEPLRRSLSAKAASCHEAVEDRANRLIEQYFHEYRDEVDVVPTRKRSVEEYDRVWRLWGTRCSELNKFLYDYCWLEDA
ncbi:MAG: hypothetical protein J0M17_22980 [Planctomycetes bacterium]|nr:hypothetical protein [Planctomycetota bacterium]